MREGWLCMGTAAVLLLAPLTLRADDVQDQLRQMETRMAELEEKLQATTDQLDAANDRMLHQQEIIDRSGIAESRPGSSGLAAFVDTLEIGGWVSASYFYNFHDPDGSALAGANTGGFAYPFKPDANSFQLDQVWFELERPVSPEHRAGFRADLVYGKTAELLNSGFVDGAAGSENDFDLYQGYVQYLAPLGSGVTFQFGKFATLIGAEVAQAPYNFNISRGHVYNLFQPITHTGVLASMSPTEETSLSLGFVNGTRTNADIDTDKDKAVLWSLGWARDTVSASFAGTYGSAEGGQGPGLPAGDKELILDLILGWDPSEKFSAYLNADYIDSENSVTLGEFDGYGVAVAGRYSLSERFGLAVRGEYADLEFDGSLAGTSDADLTVWGITTTMDYRLTHQLMLRGEVRYDSVRESDDAFRDLFFDGDDAVIGVGSEDDQFTAGVEVIYNF